MAAGVESAASAARWRLPAPVDDAAAEDLRRLTDFPPTLCAFLVRRGLVAGPTARAFLRPSLDQLHPPELLPDLTVAADRVERAIRDGEGILVHGDYDVDGMTGAALLAGAINELGGEATPFVPHRTRDGYDLGTAGVEAAEAAGARLIITVDCGVTAVQAVGLAGGRGIDVIVTDHHRPGPELPEALAVVNPNRPDHEYPFKGLAGVGVAFKLVQELFARARLTSGQLNRYLDLVALGTIADQAPLVDENRVLARFGLRVLDQTRRPGLAALMRESGVGRWSTVRSSDVAFRLAPRLNSAGRIGEAADGLALLVTSDPARSDALARSVEAVNLERREADRAILVEAKTLLETEYDAEVDRIVVLWSEGWHPGVLGIAASRLVDDLGRPAVLVSVNGDRARGSARSIPAFHLYDALASCRDLFDRFGGHSVAAGFDIPVERLPELRERLRTYAVEALPPESLGRETSIDMEIALSEVTAAFVKGFGHVEPFGAGNPVPTFVSRGVRFERLSTVGAGGDHLKAVLHQDGGTLESIFFWQGDRLAELTAEPCRDVVFELQVEEQARGPRVQAHIVDIAPCA